MKKNVLIYILTGILTQGLTFLLWILLPHFHKPEVIGEYNLLLFYMELVSTFVIFGGDSVILRYYYSDLNKFEIFGSVFWTLIFSFLIQVICLSILYSFKNGLLHIANLNIYILLICSILFNSLFNLILIHFISNKNPQTYRNLQIIRTLLFFATSLVLSYLSFGIFSFLVANIISFLFVIIVFVYKFGFSYFIFPKREIFKVTIKYAAPLAVYSTMGVITIYSSRIFIDSYLNLTLLGVFGFFNIITNQINGLLSSFNKAWTPEVFSKIQKNNSIDFIFDSIYLVVFIYLILILVGIFFGKAFLFNIFFQKIYFNYINVFIILLFYPLITSIYTILYPLFYFNDNTISIMKISIIVALFSVLITWFLTKKYGLYGSAFSILLSSVFNLSLYLIYFRNKIIIPKKEIRNFIIVFIFLVLSILFITVLNNYIIFFMLLSFAALFVFLKGNLYGKFLKKIV